MTIKIHAIQTGSVRVKQAQQVRKPGGLLGVLLDDEWTDWLPIYVWLIEHPEGLMLVDTGETARTSEPGYFPAWHPYYRGSVRMDVKPGDEIDRQLQKAGVSAADIKTVILTHLHTDHAGGLHHFSTADILMSGPDYELARGFAGRLLGYLPHRWPAWFDPRPVSFSPKAIGPFEQSFDLTPSGDVLVVPTPGHTPAHISVIVCSEDVFYFLAGDTSYSERILLDRLSDGVSPNPNITLDTADRILRFAHERPVVYLPTHDPQSALRLTGNSTLKMD